MCVAYVQGRSLLLGEFLVQEQIIRVGTVHLESLKNNAARRAQQLEIIFSILLPQPPQCAATLVMGVSASACTHLYKAIKRSQCSKEHGDMITDHEHTHTHIHAHTKRALAFSSAGLRL